MEKTTELLQLGVHVLLVDLFPPGPRDPNGIHKALWEEFDGEEVQPRPGKPLTLASYDAASLVAYVESVAVGDVLSEMPLFLQAEQYVPAPLEATYMASWNVFPAPLKGLLEP